MYERNANAMERARQDEREGESASTQAGEFVREEMHHIREGKHGAESPEQAIAIGLSKARRAGVDLAAPRKGKAPARTRKRAKRDLARGKGTGRRKRPSARRSRATRKALKRKGRRAASRSALVRKGHRIARKRPARQRRASARKAARTRRRKRRGARR